MTLWSLKSLASVGVMNLAALLLLVRVEAQFGHAEAKQGEGPAPADSEFGELERAGAKIDRDNFIGGSHE